MGWRTCKSRPQKAGIRLRRVLFTFVPAQFVTESVDIGRRPSASSQPGVITSLRATPFEFVDKNVQLAPLLYIFRHPCTARRGGGTPNLNTGCVSQLGNPSEVAYSDEKRGYTRPGRLSFASGTFSHPLGLRQSRPLA